MCRKRSASRTAGWLISSSVVHVLDLAVDDADAMLEERRQIAAGEIAVLVDGGRQHRAAVLAIPGGVVGAAAEEGDSEGSSADDHSMTSSRNTVNVPCPPRGYPSPAADARGRADVICLEHSQESGRDCQAGFEKSEVCAAVVACRFVRGELQRAKRQAGKSCWSRLPTTET